MRILNIAKSNIVSLDYKDGKVDWSKFSIDFTNKINEAKSDAAIDRILKANESSLYQLSTKDTELFETTSVGITTAIRKFQNNMLSEAKWALPKNDKDVEVIVKNLKNGIKAGTAGHKMYNTLGDKGLFDLIGALKTQDSTMDVTAPVVNHVMQMEPASLPVQYQESMKKLQESILNDARLALMILQPTSLNESSGINPIDHAASALHADLKAMTEDSDDVDTVTNEKFKRLAIRANQIKLAPSELKQYYMRKFNKSNLLEQDDVTKAAFQFIDSIKQFKDLKKTHPDAFKIKFHSLLHRTAVLNNISVKDIKDKCKELSSKAVPVTEGEDQRQKQLYDLAFFTDSIGQIIRFGQTYNEFKKMLEPNFGKKFTDEFSFLTAEGDSKDYHRDNISAIFQRLQSIDTYGKPEDKKFIDTINQRKTEIMDIAKKAREKTIPKKDPVRVEPSQNKPQARNAHFAPGVRLQKRNFVIGKYSKNSSTAHYWFNQIEQAAKPIILDLVNQPTIELSAVENLLSNSIEFRRLVQKSGVNYSDAIAHVKNVVEFEHPEQQINEDVVPFTGNKKPATMQIKPAKVIDLPMKTNDGVGLDDIVTFGKSLLDDSDTKDPNAKWNVIGGIEASLVSRGLTVDQFLKAFESKFGLDFYEYMHGKGISKLDRNEQVKEAISGKTAKHARQDMWKMMRKLVDSSNLAMLSNFETYEDVSHISLKMNVYEDNVGKLTKVQDSAIKKMMKAGFQEAGKNRYVKDDVTIKTTPIRKTFRSGPYKNRETPTWGIEIVGPKKLNVEKL